MKELDEITGTIVDAAIKIHREFGPGLLESVYEKILMAELESRGLAVECQKPLSLTYAGRTFSEAYRVDMLVDGCVIVELKSTAQMAPVFPKQLRTYLVLSNLHVGLLLNFGMNTMKDGIVRVVNNYTPKTSAGGNTPPAPFLTSAPSAFSAGGNTPPAPFLTSAPSAFSAGGNTPPATFLTSAPSAFSAGGNTPPAPSHNSAKGHNQ